MQNKLHLLNQDAPVFAPLSLLNKHCPQSLSIHSLYLFSLLSVFQGHCLSQEFVFLENHTHTYSFIHVHRNTLTQAHINISTQ